MSKKFFLFFIIFIFQIFNSFADKVDKIEIIGNERITKDTILIFGKIDDKADFTDEELNKILKNLYNTNFFDDIKISISNKVLKIVVVENPIVQEVKILGVKAKKYKDPLFEAIKVKKNNSFNEYLVKKDKDLILNILRSSGYYFAEVILEKILNDNNTISLIYNVNLGKRAKIKKIKFIGDKKYKNRKLFRVIASEEDKFWKFISQNRLLNQSRIKLDERLLTSYYKNKGYYKVKVETSFAELSDDGMFDLTFNINSGNKFYFNDLNLNIPSDYNEENFEKIQSYFKKLKNKAYSFKSIENILKQVELIALKDEYQSINAMIEEQIVENNKLNFTIFFDDSEKFIVERINIIGNNITREDVIRNNLALDEGDTFNKILHKKSINNLKALNYFKEIDTEIISGTDKLSKIINIEVEEKPTGEISAGAGFGTSGTTIAFGVKENNFLGRGIEFSTNLEVSDESIRGKFGVNNPNFRGSDRSLFTNIESTEIDRLTNYGYKTTKTGFTLGSGFEYFQDVTLSPSISSFYESLKTDSSASNSLQKQKGTYFDTDINYLIDYDKRNQKYQPSDGFRSRFTQSIPLVSDTHGLVNGYEFNFYQELFNDVITSFSYYGKAINSITGEDIRISERLHLPSSKLRGFERGRVGPRDGSDYVGGNYVSAVNLAATLPNILPNWQNADFSIFLDAGNVWGVDYSSSIDDSNGLRSSAGIALDWFTPVGPLSFSYAGVLSKENTDKTESFRFNLGTTF
tara:strand:- start:739 stop:2979 length:2241 start_codon:yes stop_codon:yes gene_type:complete